MRGFFRHLAEGLVEPYSTLWFIYALAIVSLVTKLVRPVQSSVVLAAAAAIHIMPVPTGSFFVKALCENWFFFLAGYLFAPLIFDVADWARTHRARAVALLAAWAIVNGALALTELSTAESTITLAALPIASLAVGCAGAGAIVILAAVLSTMRLGTVMRYVGARSIVIYLTFFLPMAATRVALTRTGLIDNIGLVSAIVTVTAVTVPLVVGWLVQGTWLAFLYSRPAWARLKPTADPMRLTPAE